MNWKISKLLVIAHRGDTKQAVENTLPAVESALRLGVDGIEADLQLTRDGRIVVFHDKDLRRLAGSDCRIESSDLPKLREFRLGTSAIAALEELLDLVRDRALLNLEIKTVNVWDAKLEKKLIEQLQIFRLKESILISSFNPLPLRRLRRMAPQLARGYLFQGRYPLRKRIIPWVDPFSIHARHEIVSKALADSVHEAGRRFFAWTVNAENDMNRCLEAGVDGIITDEPQKLLKMLNRKE